MCIPARTTLIKGRRTNNYGQAEYVANWRLDRDRCDLLGSRHMYHDGRHKLLYSMHDGSGLGATQHLADQQRSLPGGAINRCTDVSVCEEQT